MRRKAKRDYRVWVRYHQMIGRWEYLVASPGMTIWSQPQYQTEYDAEDAAVAAFREYWPNAAIPATRIFRTGIEYHTEALRY